MKPDGLHSRIHKVVRRIPRGRVATYGQIARLAGIPGQARLVGYALHALPAGHSLPWHRVINAQGKCSTGRVVLPHNKQQLMLEYEGVAFDKNGRCELQQFLYIPKGKKR